MYDSWTCLLVEKGPGILSDKIRDALKLAACELAVEKVERMNMRNELCDGIIQTEWKSHNVGSRSGILFRAQITEAKGDFYVNFLLSEDDLKRGADIIREMRENEREGSWSLNPERYPVPELYEFKDLSKRKLH